MQGSEIALLARSGAEADGLSGAEDTKSHGDVSRTSDGLAAMLDLDQPNDAAVHRDDGDRVTVEGDRDEEPAMQTRQVVAMALGDPPLRVELALLNSEADTGVGSECLAIDVPRKRGDSRHVTYSFQLLIL